MFFMQKKRGSARHHNIYHDTTFTQGRIEKWVNKSHNDGQYEMKQIHSRNIQKNALERTGRHSKGECIIISHINETKERW